MLTVTGDFDAAVFLLGTLLFDFTVAGGASRAGETLQREALKNNTEFTLLWL